LDTRFRQTGPVARAFLPRLAVALALCLLTFAYHGGGWRYATAGENILTNGDFALGTRHWYGSRGGGAQVDPDRRTAQLYRDQSQTVLPFILQPIAGFRQHSHLRIGGDIRIAGIRAGPQPWQWAILALESFNRPTGKMRYWPHIVARLQGAADWQRHERVIPVSPNAGMMRLVAFVGADSGRMSLKQLSIVPVRPTAAARAAGVGLALLWLAAIGWIVTPLLQRRNRSLGRLVVMLGGAAILLGGLAPQPQLGQVVRGTISTVEQGLQRLESSVERAAPEHPARPTPPPEGAAPEAEQERAGPDGEKAAETAPSRERAAGQRAAPRLSPSGRRLSGAEHAGHFVAFMVLALLASAAYGRRSIGLVTVGLLLLALCGETLQHFSITRDAELADLAYNFGGVAAGATLSVVLFALSAALRRRRL
jgi:VanZ family protein